LVLRDPLKVWPEANVWLNPIVSTVLSPALIERGGDIATEESPRRQELSAVFVFPMFLTVT